MTIWVSMLGGTRIERDRMPIKVNPGSYAVLVRLALDAGRYVPSSVLSADALPRQRAVRPGVVTPEGRRKRTQVQKAVSELRRALDPTRPGAQSVIIEAEPGPDFAYRLNVTPEQVDLLRFEDLITQARVAPEVEAMHLLKQAVALWQGRPLADVADRPWAQPRIAALHALYDSARRRLLDLYLKFRLFDEATRLGTELLAAHPDDAELKARVDAIGDVRAAAGIRRSFSDPPTTISVGFGDVLDQDDAHLIVGFMDTFETNTANDFLVSSHSLQGKLLSRFYGGDHRRLDRALNRALAGVPFTRESREVKQYGKLIRYPVGTVAVIRQGGRFIFCVAYSKVGPNGRHPRSSRELLAHSLEQLWPVVRARAQYRPVATAVLGGGLSRIPATRVELAEMLFSSFLRHHAQGRLTDELRVLLPPTDGSDPLLYQLGELLHRLELPTP